MKTKKACIWILMTVLLVSLLAGCSKADQEPISTSGGGKTKTAQRDNSKKSPEKEKSDDTNPGITEEETTQGEEELAAITGTWYAEESYGYAELTIDASGSFSWMQERPGEKAEVTEGTLQYEDGEADWGVPGLIRGPRFEMFDEDGAFLQYALVKNDSGDVHDGKLSMLDGGGAWLYTREKPEPKPETETDGLALYESVLEEADRVFREGYDFDLEYRYFPMGLIERVMYNAQNDAHDEVGYKIEDISGDGIPELLIGENMDVTGTAKPFCLIYGCYTVKNGSIVRTFEGYTRSSHTWLGNGHFSYWGSNGVGNILLGDAHLSTDGTELAWDDFYFSDTVGETTHYYHNKTGFYDAEQSELITEDAFSEIMDMYRDDDRVQTLDLTPMRSFGSNEEYRIGEGPFAIFGGQYQNDNAGVVSNIWDQSTGIVFSFGIENASFQGDTSFDDVRGRLGFFAVDYSTDEVVTGYVEKDGDGIRVTFTGSDSKWISEGDVYTLARVN